MQSAGKALKERRGRGEALPCLIFLGTVLALCPALPCQMGPGAVSAPVRTTADQALALPPRAWADAAAANQEHILNGSDTVPLRYRMRKIDTRGDLTREVIESREGNVARVVERNGMPLTAEEDRAERARLNAILGDPDDFARHRRRERAGREYALELIRALPSAMVWSYAPGQPPLPHTSGPAIVLDFSPNPKYKPPGLVTEGLSGFGGRIWIDAQTRCVLRIDGRILHSVDFGWAGMLARVKEGGTVELEQMQVTDHRWLYTHFSDHLTLREMLVHTAVEEGQSNAWDAHPLPASLSVGEAVHELLAMPVTTR